MTSDQPQIIPAATLVIMRECDGGAPELLMVERAAAMRFAGGALVFPGGRIDPGDHVLAGLIGSDDADDAAARVAAIRETIEEVGLAIGLRGRHDVTAIRAALAEGAALGELIAGDAIDMAALVPFARWLPRGLSHRIFDTRFYLAQLPPDAPEPQADGGESVRLFWASAAQVLADADAGRAQIIYPTRRNLERLAQFGSFAQAVAHAHAHPVETVTPWIEDRDGQPHLCIPDGLGYPVTSQPTTSAQRG
jgi:8-oxo-dGTP pyrophosphatase MutT (NUDIX family)